MQRPCGRKEHDSYKELKVWKFWGASGEWKAGKQAEARLCWA